MKYRIGAGIIALLMVILGAIATPAQAGDAPVGVDHNEKVYTKAEVEKITKSKQDQAKRSGATGKAAALAGGYYDWYLIGQQTISGGSIYEPNIGVLRLYWNSFRQANKARTEHINSYVGWATYTSVSLCETNGSGACVRTVSDGPALYSYYAGDVVLDFTAGKCVKAWGLMVANRSNNASKWGYLGPGWCG